MKHNGGNQACFVLGQKTPSIRDLYSLGHKLGQGQFGTTYMCREISTGREYACKSITKRKLISKEDVEDVRREIQIMHHLAGYKNIVTIKGAYEDPLYVHIVMELCSGGELFDRIIQRGHYSERKAAELIKIIVGVVEACHSLGVMHRDLKPENFLLVNKDDDFSLKAIDFGLSVFFKTGQIFEDVVGTPNYVAPEVLSHKGYNGAVADVWSCGVILYVLMAGYLPFDEMDLPTLYSKIDNAEFSCPSYFALGAKSLIRRILDPNPETRITIAEIRKDEWFVKDCSPVQLIDYEHVNLDDVYAAFDDPEEQKGAQDGTGDTGPLTLNAFDLIVLSQGLNLATLFDRGKDSMKHETRFISHRPANVILSSMEVVSQSMGFKTHIRNYKMRVEGLSANKTSHFSVILEVFKVAPSFLMVDIQNSAGDAEEYLKFYKTFCSKLDDIIWKPPDASVRNRATKPKSKRR